MNSLEINHIERFKYLLKKIGSGQHTSKDLDRNESAEALILMLEGKASPAQIGAYLISQRIKRPTPDELAGMIDVYRDLGPQLISEEKAKHPICFGMPFDGRNKTSPIYPLTTLVLLSHNQPVVLQGGQRMPTKYGITTIELFAQLGIQLQGKSIEEVQKSFHTNGFAFVYQPDHFPLAESLIQYRNEIGKRPTLATLELLWTTHQGKHLLISGFVHPATEDLALDTLNLIGEKNFCLIKGLEGGIDLPISKRSILRKTEDRQLERTILEASKYNLSGKDLPWKSLEEWHKNALEALKYQGPMKESLIWNAGVYLWICGHSSSPSEGIKTVTSSIKSGLVEDTLQRLIHWKA